MELATFIGLKIPGDIVLDNLNRIIYHLKGVWILSYYVPKNPNKEKERLLDGELCNKLLPPKSDAQTEWNRTQSLIKAKIMSRRKQKIKEKYKKQRAC